ncbi:hypothetical protein OK016_22885 [Vibrio chagasii]|nr:hypothetical protein [Vibrio chagasii]
MKKLLNYSQRQLHSPVFLFQQQTTPLKRVVMQWVVLSCCFCKTSNRSIL